MTYGGILWSALERPWLTMGEPFLFYAQNGLFNAPFWLVVSLDGYSLVESPDFFC